jgi:outer membrane protein OmpA-like peptidoglycan-associated protein
MMPIAFARSLVLAAALVPAAAFIAGCAAPPQATAISDELPFDQAVAQATDGLIGQTQKLPAFLLKVEAKLAKKSVVIDAMIDSGTGQQTIATKQLEKYVTDRLAANEQFEVLPFQLASLPKSQYLLTGTMTRVQKTGGKGSFKINLALTELKSGNTVAQASAVAREQGVDTAPTPYYRDSPVLVKDKVIEGYIRTSQTPPGQRADSIYFERIATATLIDNATNLYNNERYQDALGQFKNALSTPAGEQLRVLNGLYLSNFKLGRMADAEQAFGRVVALGIAYNELGVKFLFNPGGTEFWSDQKISGPYQMWLRQIAREGNAAKVCMNVVGHTSRTGSEQVNDTLSQQRATFIRQRLAAESADLATRTKAIGMGFRQNIVGSGTDDVVDALDRRVEFKIVPCG